MPPYLKGLHLTLDGWRPGRDADGYRPRKGTGKPVFWEWEAESWVDVDANELKAMETMEAPERVKAAPRLHFDIGALLELTKGDAPAEQRCRVSGTFCVNYVLGDASGKAFGSARCDAGGADARTGCWSKECQEQSSNWREAKNLALSIEAMKEEGTLHDREIFIFTDNIVFEGTFYKGHSSSPLLNQIILDLRVLERTGGCILHVIHVAGTRMKRSGIDGLSRGDFFEGIMAGHDPLQYIPLNEGANEQVDGRVEEWVNSWWSLENGEPWFGDKLRLLSPEDWFLLHTFSTPRLWMPPPAAMEVVMEMFNEDRLAHPRIPHVFCLPRLMTHLWRKQLKKDADVMFTVSTGASFWPKDMHEPLIISIVFPFAHVPNYRGPWSLKYSPETASLVRLLEAGFKDPAVNGSRKFYDVGGTMPDLWKSEEKWSGSLLRKFLNTQRTFPPVSKCLVRGMLSGGRDRSVPGADQDGRRRKRRLGDGDGRPDSFPTGTKRRLFDGNPI